MACRTGRYRCDFRDPVAKFGDSPSYWPFWQSRWRPRQRHPQRNRAAPPGCDRAIQPESLYCDRLPLDLPPGGFTCIAVETIELIDPSSGKRAGGVSLAQTGVIDKWHWKRNATIYMEIKDAAGNVTVVGSVNESLKVSLDGRRSTTQMTMQAVTSGPIKPRLKSTCIKDNSWFGDSDCQPSSLVAYTTWTAFLVSNSDTFYHSADDLYWYKYERKFWARDHWNPSQPDGVWLAPEGFGYVASANFNCDRGFPATELCRFN